MGCKGAKKLALMRGGQPEVILEPTGNTGETSQATQLLKQFYDAGYAKGLVDGKAEVAGELQEKYDLGFDDAERFYLPKLDEARETGRIQGLEEGRPLGDAAGYARGLAEGKVQGFQEGLSSMKLDILASLPLPGDVSLDIVRKG